MAYCLAVVLLVRVQGVRQEVRRVRRVSDLPVAVSDLLGVVQEVHQVARQGARQARHTGLSAEGEWALHEFCPYPAMAGSDHSRQSVLSALEVSPYRSHRVM